MSMCKTVSGKQLNTRLKKVEEYEPGRQEAWVLMLTFFCVAFFSSNYSDKHSPIQKEQCIKNSHASQE